MISKHSVVELGGVVLLKAILCSQFQENANSKVLGVVISIFKSTDRTLVGGSQSCVNTDFVLGSKCPLV